MRLLGYPSALSVAPGDRLQFMVSSEPGDYDARLVRLLDSAVGNGAGVYESPVASTIEGRHRGYPQRAQTGSFIRATGLQSLNIAGDFTIALWALPTRPTISRWQALMVKSTRLGALTVGLFVTDAGDALCAVADVKTGEVKVRTGVPLRANSWYFISVTCSRALKKLELQQRPLSRWLAHEHAHGQTKIVHPPSWTDGCLHFGAFEEADQGRQQRVSALYNGKIEAPCIWAEALSYGELEAMVAGTDPSDIRSHALRMRWDFCDGWSSPQTFDRGPLQLQAQVVNCPSRGATGHRWNGTIFDPRCDPRHYGAIHFHEDDLEDSGWSPSLELEVPTDLPSGVYAAKLTQDSDQEYVPFAVTPPRGQTTARVALLLPTFSYLAYGNMVEIDRQREMLRKASSVEDVAIGDQEKYLVDHPELGRSLYDRHVDGHIVCYSSALRPLLNMRPNYKYWVTGTPRYFSADLCLIGWLHRKGFATDIITDHDVHRRGVGLLRPYDVVLTGSHPEYCSSQLWDALSDYVAAQGHLMYLGGNGFFWVTTVDLERPHLIEVRRGWAGSRTGDNIFGEQHHSMTGEPGGQWRFRDRPAQRLVGVGTTAIGWRGGAGYQRTRDSYARDKSFVFEGVSGEVIGEFGPLGGAAGIEMDRVDGSLGSPPQTTVLATSQGRHDDEYQGLLDDVELMLPAQGGSENPRVRADMALVEAPSGGLVFSVGSIAWSLCLAAEWDENDVSQITENVLRHFLAQDRK
jgi:N,N-dimethylformamidase